MNWNDLTDDEKIVELARQSQYVQPGSAAADLFGAGWDRAAIAGAAFGLSAGETLAAERMSMTPREYAALQSQSSLDDYRKLEATGGTAVGYDLTGGVPSADYLTLSVTQGGTSVSGTVYVFYDRDRTP